MVQNAVGHLIGVHVTPEIWEKMGFQVPSCWMNVFEDQ